MNAREHILAAVNREPVNRTLIEIWLTPEVLDQLWVFTGEEGHVFYQNLNVDKTVWTFAIKSARLKRDFGEQPDFDDDFENRQALENRSIEDIHKEPGTHLQTLNSRSAYIPCPCRNTKAFGQAVR